jgi:hypothetical protein
MLRNPEFSALIETLALTDAVKDDTDRVMNQDFRQFLGHGDMKQATIPELQIVKQYLQTSPLLRSMGVNKPQSCTDLYNDIVAELATR